MTIPSTTRKAGPLLGTGAQTAWPFTFKVFAESDIAVTIADSLGLETALVLDTDYSVALNANQETSPGGTVTYPLSGTALATGSVLSIVGDLDYDQPLDLPSGGNFSPVALENELDRITMQVQQLRETISRSLLVPVTSDAAPALPFPEANQLIGWDATGSTLQNVPVSDLATAVAYGTFRYDTFTGNGVTTQYTLTSDPAAVGNLDVAMDGLTMVPGTDYSLASGVLVFTVAPSSGAEILARYGQAIPSVGGVDASAVTYQPAGAGSEVTDVQAELRLKGHFAANFTGYDDTGATDSTAAIQAAINAANADGTHTVYITGKPKIAAPLTYSLMLALVGVGGGDVFSNDFDAYPTRINCHAVTGYVFDQPDVVDGSGTLSISNIAFDGRSAALVKSSTWQGLVKAATTPGTSSFFLRLRNVMVGNSLCVTPILNMSSEVFAKLENCFFANWWYGYGIQTTGASLLGTTLSFDKCYWNSLRQVAEFYDNQTDVQFNDCVMESCVVGVAALKTNVTFNNLYSENMGYDPSGTAITTGLTARSFGIADAPAIAGNVSAVFTCRYGQMIFNQPTIQNTTGGKKWFDGIGRFSALGQGGLIELNGISLAAGTVNTIFTADVDAPTSKANFEYKATTKVATAVFTEADARLLTVGRVNIQYSDGTLRPTEVNNGLYTLPALAFNGITSMPTTKYPDSGTWKVGDQIKLAPSTGQQGYPNSYICSVAGTTGAGWDINGFIPSSKTASVAAAGTMLVQASQMNTGDLHVWEVLASNGANILSFYRVSMEAFTGVGQLFTEALVTTNTLTFTMGWGGPYTITITNTSGATLSIYARLVSMTSTHT